MATMPSGATGSWRAAPPVVLLVGLRALANRRAGRTTGGRSTRRLGGKGKEGDPWHPGRRPCEDGEGVAGTLGDAVALLEGVLRSAPADGAKSAA
jgi:hypothetical protein